MKQLMTIVGSLAAHNFFEAIQSRFLYFFSSHLLEASYAISDTCATVARIGRCD